MGRSVFFLSSLHMMIFTRQSVNLLFLDHMILKLTHEHDCRSIVDIHQCTPGATPHTVLAHFPSAVATHFTSPLHLLIFTLLPDCTRHSLSSLCSHCFFSAVAPCYISMRRIFTQQIPSVLLYTPCSLRPKLLARFLTQVTPRVGNR